MSTEFSKNERKDYEIPCRLLPFTELDMGPHASSAQRNGVAVGGLVRDEMMHEAVELESPQNASTDRKPMAHIRVELQDERGICLADEITFPSNVLPSLEDDRFYCLRFIDPYGDTVFNCRQMPSLLREIGMVLSRAQNNEDQAAIKSVESLAKKCQTEPHLYLKFIGD